MLLQGYEDELEKRVEIICSFLYVLLKTAALLSTLLGKNVNELAKEFQFDRISCKKKSQ